MMSVAHVTVPVGDYDEALSWYTEKLGLEVRADSSFGPGYRWIAVGAKDQRDLDLVLHLSGERRVPRELDGVPPLLVFFTDDCRGEYDRLKARGVRFTRSPQELPWAIQAIFEDPYGNRFVLVQRKTSAAAA